MKINQLLLHSNDSFNENIENVYEKNVIEATKTLFYILNQNQGTKNQDNISAVNLMNTIVKIKISQQGEQGFEDLINNGIKNMYIQRNRSELPTEENYKKNTHYLLLQILIPRYKDCFKNWNNVQEINALMYAPENWQRLNSQYIQEAKIIPFHTSSIHS